MSVLSRYAPSILCLCVAASVGVSAAFQAAPAQAPTSRGVQPTYSGKWLAKKDGLTLEFVVDRDGVRSVSFEASVKVAKPCTNQGVQMPAGLDLSSTFSLERLAPAAPVVNGAFRVTDLSNETAAASKRKQNFIVAGKFLDSTSATGTVTIVCPAATLQWRAVKQ